MSSCHRDRGHRAEARSPRRPVKRGYGWTTLRYQPLSEGRLIPVVAGSCTLPYLDSTLARHLSVRLGGSGLVPRASDGRLLAPSACLVRFALLWQRVGECHCYFAPRGAPVRNRFPLHRSPLLFTMEHSTVQARFLWPWEIFSFFKDLTSPRRSSAGREQLPPFPRPAFTGFIGTPAAPPGIDLLLHPQLGWSARPVRADRSIPFPRSPSSRLHPDVGTD